MDVLRNNFGMLKVFPEPYVYYQHFWYTFIVDKSFFHKIISVKYKNYLFIVFRQSLQLSLKKILRSFTDYF